jgi:hypothetical protein
MAPQDFSNGSALSGVEIQYRARRNNASRVYLPMALTVVALDVVEIHRVLDSRHLVTLARVRPNRGIVDETPDVAFEVTVINQVEPDQRGEKSPVGFSQYVAAEETLPG